MKAPPDATKAPRDKGPRLVCTRARGAAICEAIVYVSVRTFVGTERAFTHIAVSGATAR